MKTTGRKHIAHMGIPALLLTVAAWSFALMDAQEALSQQAQSESQVTVPNRPSTPLFQGEQGKQRSEVEFNPSGRVVTLKLQVQDPNGYFLPNIRRENFAVYEDQQPQKIVSVDIEHASLSLAILVEFGGRYLEINKVLALEIPEIGHALLENIGHDDKVAIFKYDGKLENLADFDHPQQTLDHVFDPLNVPGFSEANFYDAVLGTLQRVKDVSGRRAIIAVSTGIDTFSNANYDRVLQSVRSSEIPMYAIGLSRLMQKETTIYGRPGESFGRTCLYA
jgi:Ca-activated chloride channel family protein